MRVVLLSGGSGKRLWPMSNDSRSKQFLKVLTNEHGTRISMLQRVWSQLTTAGLRDTAYICAPKAQYDTIESQVEQVNFIEEPTRRDTFPAIALASTYLSDVERLSDDEVVVVIPVDSFVDDTYFQAIRQLEDILNKSDADIALMGVLPTAPTSKFGYIRVAPREGLDASYQCVASFVEKPHEELALSLIAEGALWNCGVFAFRIGFIRKHLEQGGHPNTFRNLSEMYALLPKRSFDYEVVEQTKRIVVIPYNGSWEDLGTWGSLSEKMGESFVGQGASVDCHNTHVINELGVPLVAMGLNDMMIVATPDGILAADKEAAASVKNVIGEYSSYPMYEERCWGTYRVLDYQKLGDGTEVLTKSIILKTGKNISYQMHAKRTEVWTIVKGSGEVVIGSVVQAVQPGDVIRIEAGKWHAVRAVEPLHLIEVQCGTELTEDDIVRSELSWDEVVGRSVATVG